MSKILSQAGSSLADIYDVEGSIAGIDTLETRELPIVHEMGATVFAERLSGSVLRMTSTAVAASTVWNITVAPPAGIYRVLAVYVEADAARCEHVQVSLRSIDANNDFPIFIWDQTNDIESEIRIIENNTALATNFALIQTSPQMSGPTLGISRGQRGRTGEQIIMRGVSTAFGAGTVEVVAHVHVAASETTSINSIGVPIPGW